MFHGFNYGTEASQSVQRSTDKALEGLTNSLIDPRRPSSKPHAYEQSWPGLSTLQNRSSHNANHSSHSPNLGAYYPLHQREASSFDNGTKPQTPDDLNTQLNKNQMAKSAIQPKENQNPNADRQQLQTRLQDLMKHPALRGPASEGEARPSQVAPDNVSPSTEGSLLNDRAAELRAKLLAKRGSTPITSSGSARNHRSAELPGQDNKDTKKQNGGVGGKTNTHHSNLVQTPHELPDVNKSADYRSTSSSGKGNASTDIDVLFAEERAAVALQSTKKKSDVQNDINVNVASNEERIPSVPGSRNDTEVADQRQSLRKKFASSETPEIGEIYDESSDESKHLGSQEAQQNNQNIKPRDQQPHNNTSTMQKSSNAINADHKPPNAEQSRIHHLENGRDYNGQRPSEQSIRRESQTDRYRDLEVHNKYTDSTHPSIWRPNLHEQKPDDSRNQKDNQVFRLHPPRYDGYNAEKNARAAAEYKKGLELRRQPARPVIDEVDPSLKDRKEGAEAGLAKAITSKGAEMQHTNFNRKTFINNTKQENKSGHIVKEQNHQDVQPEIEDLRDWLEMTGYLDESYRTTALARFRKIRDLDHQKAELEREAQRDLEGRSLSGRTSNPSSIGVDAHALLMKISPHVLPSSVKPIVPQLSGSKEVSNNATIKTKDSMNHSSSNYSHKNELRIAKNPTEAVKLLAQGLKRPHPENDSKLADYKHAEKLHRIDSNGRAVELKQQPDTTSDEKDSGSIENRSSRPYDHSARSISRERRGKSISPIRGRASRYDQYVPRPRSRGSPTRRNTYQTNRRANRDYPEESNNDVGRVINATDMTSNSSSSYQKQIVNQKQQKDGGSETHQRSDSRPFLGHYQPHPPSHRGFGKESKAGLSSTNGYSNIQSSDGALDSIDGSATLNLEAGGRCLNRIKNPFFHLIQYLTLIYLISFSDTRYFMIKSWNSENVEIAQRDVSLHSTAVFTSTMDFFIIAFRRLINIYALLFLTLSFDILEGYVGDPKEESRCFDRSVRDLSQCCAFLFCQQ